MNKLILCEGATDAILLSYYLEKTAGWTFCRKPPKDLQIKSVEWEKSEVLQKCFSELIKI